MRALFCLFLLTFLAMAINGQPQLHGHSTVGVSTADTSSCNRCPSTNEAIESQYTYCYHFCLIDNSWGIDGDSIGVAILDSNGLSVVYLTDPDLDINNVADFPGIQAELNSIFNTSQTWVIPRSATSSIIDIRIPDVQIGQRPLFLISRGDKNQLSAPFDRSCRWW